MSSRHVVVDGSNIATEGRSMPSLAQLDQAVREFMGENPVDVVTVVVDASFGHRIDPSEVSMYEEAETAGELVSPPAGAIGRGDAFLLRIADKMDATVLSNDSFQEFHGEHVWLFDKGRLIGGKPVPGVGWIFTPRTPVRGPKSREAVKEAKRTKKGDLEPSASSAASAASAGSAGSAIPGLDLAAERARGKGKGKKTVERAIAVATEEAVEPKGSTRRRRRSKSGAPPAEPVNEPLTFITFIAAHPLGTEVDGVVDSFASHGAFVEVEGARCYLPLSAMGNPPPRSGREVFARGDARRFVIQALDPQRRGIELALPGFVRVAGTPTEETVEAEIAGEVPEAAVVPIGAGRRRGRKPAAAVGLAAGSAEEAAPLPGPAKRSRKAGATAVAGSSADAPSEPGRKRAAKSATAPPAKKAATRKAGAGKGAPAIADRKTRTDQAEGRRRTTATAPSGAAPKKASAGRRPEPVYEAPAAAAKATRAKAAPAKKTKATKPPTAKAPATAPAPAAKPPRAAKAPAAAAKAAASKARAPKPSAAPVKSAAAAAPPAATKAPAPSADRSPAKARKKRSTAPPAPAETAPAAKSPPKRARPAAGQPAKAPKSAKAARPTPDLA
jgi:Zc3h12a-like Ribonuclease NYN domain/S1 RNA binding domain